MRVCLPLFLSGPCSLVCSLNILDSASYYYYYPTLVPCRQAGLYASLSSTLQRLLPSPLSAFAAKYYSKADVGGAIDAVDDTLTLSLAWVLTTFREELMAVVRKESAPGVVAEAEAAYKLLSG